MLLDICLNQKIAKIVQRPCHGVHHIVAAYLCIRILDMIEEQAEHMFRVGGPLNGIVGSILQRAKESPTYILKSLDHPVVHEQEASAHEGVGVDFFDSHPR